MKNSAGGTPTLRYFDLPVPLILESGQNLFPVRIAYETYGRLNRRKSNAILICHALSGDSHAAGLTRESAPGWWDIVIGPGKAFDTDRYFIICSNVIGGCKGSTGPSSTNPETKRPYGISFPVITIGDMVRAQKALIDHLGIQQLFAVAGGSMGGMQVLQWAVSYPQTVRKAIVIASTSASTPQQIAFNEVGRQAIISDPEWNGGDYYDLKSYDSAGPVRGLSLARMVGHITYLSDASIHEKFGRNLQKRERLGYDFSTEFQVESYLHHQGDTFTRRFDANSYLYITKAIDYFDIRKEGSLISSFEGLKASFLVISVTSDWLYPPYQSEEIVAALNANDVDVQYCEIRSVHGHDAFLLEGGQLNYLIGRFLSHTLVRDVMVREVATITEGSTIREATKLMIDREINHLPVLSEEGLLVGIVTSWDIAKAIACDHVSLEEIMTHDVITTTPETSIEEAAKKMAQHTISALPVIDENERVVGIVSSEGLSTLVGRCR
ncbi:MAG: homoserine O-acetyltransferase [Methanomicrobiales archaeon]|nr:homoserine O-acetyltransferase [Methanomicrobiales archaeon]